MIDERKYGDEEVREIFERASDPDRGGSAGPPPPEGSGLTLHELQTIGREVGLEPDAVARAAAALDRAAVRVPRRKLLGSPISVGRVVELDRGLTDREWEVLVAELRQTFGAKGKVESHGQLRSWTNSRLHVHVEPTPTGYRLRMGTLKGNALLLGGMGAGALAIGVLWLVLLTVTGGLAEDATRPLMYAVFGVGALVANAVRLPPWAAERERQMEHIAEQVTRMVGESREDDGLLGEGDAGG